MIFNYLSNVSNDSLLLNRNKTYVTERLKRFIEICFIGKLKLVKIGQYLSRFKDNSFS